MSQLRLVPDLPLLGGGRDNRRIQQGIENRGFNQIKKFLRGNKLDNKGFVLTKKILGIRCTLRGGLQSPDSGFQEGPLNVKNTLK